MRRKRVPWDGDREAEHPDGHIPRFHPLLSVDFDLVETRNLIIPGIREDEFYLRRVFFDLMHGNLPIVALHRDAVGPFTVLVEGIPNAVWNSIFSCSSPVILLPASQEARMYRGCLFRF